MKLLISLFISGTLILACKWRVAKETTATEYWSISDSKKNGAFVQQFKPQSPSISLGGKIYYINEAWIEHPHYEKTFKDEIDEYSYSFIMTFKHDKKKENEIDLRSYIDAIADGDIRIRLFLPTYDKLVDTIKINYRDSLTSSEMGKTFLLFKIK